jgi:hypothetical protein
VRVRAHVWEMRASVVPGDHDPGCSGAHGAADVVIGLREVSASWPSCTRCECSGAELFTPLDPVARGNEAPLCGECLTCMLMDMFVEQQYEAWRASRESGKTVRA